jgi:NitT/TauT family transport system permease protein
MQRVFSGLALIFGVWAAAHYSGIANPQILPSPAESVRRLGQLLASGGLNSDLVASGWRWLCGFGLGVMLGAPFGLAMGYSRWAGLLLDFPVDFFRSLPVSSLFPVFLLIFGIQDASKVAMIATAVGFTMVVTAHYGVRHAPRTRQAMAQVFGASTAQRLRDVILPEALGQIVAGMRVSLGTSLVVLVLAEMLIGSRHGIGQRLFDSYSVNAATDMFALILLTGSIGYLLNVAFQAVERRFVFWVGK